MVEENKTGVVDAEAAAQPTGDTQKTDVQSDATPAAEGNQVKGLEAALVAERTKTRAAEDTNSQLQQQMTLLSANQPQSQTAQVPQTLYHQVATRLGIDPEYPTAVEQGKIMEAMNQITVTQQQETTFLAQHPDYDKVVGTLGPTGFIEAPPLKRVLDTNPALRTALYAQGNTPHAKMLAYQIASGDAELIKEKGMTPEEKIAADVEATVAAANAQQSISAAPGAGTLDKVEQMRTMSETDFQAKLAEQKSKAG